MSADRALREQLDFGECQSLIPFLQPALSGSLQPSGLCLQFVSEQAPQVLKGEAAVAARPVHGLSHPGLHK